MDWYGLGAAHGLGLILQPQKNALLDRHGFEKFAFIRWEFGRFETLERSGAGKNFEKLKIVVELLLDMRESAAKIKL